MTAQMQEKAAQHTHPAKLLMEIENEWQENFEPR